MFQSGIILTYTSSLLKHASLTLQKEHPRKEKAEGIEPLSSVHCSPEQETGI